MQKVLAVISLTIVGVKCTWEDPFLTVSNSTKFIFTPDKDFANNVSNKFISFLLKDNSKSKCYFLLNFGNFETEAIT